MFPARKIRSLDLRNVHLGIRVLKNGKTSRFSHSFCSIHSSPLSDSGKIDSRGSRAEAQDRHRRTKLESAFKVSLGTGREKESIIEAVPVNVCILYL